MRKSSVRTRKISFIAVISVGLLLLANPSYSKEIEFDREIGVKTVIDLRTDREVEKAPTAWQRDNPPEIHHLPIFSDDSDWYRAQSRVMNKNRFSEADSLGHMVEGYRMIAEVGSPADSEVMDLVLDESNWPILIHCSAGKDRSGIAVALIQEALGVDRDGLKASLTPEQPELAMVK